MPYPTADCTGKVVLVTGGNAGLGLEASRHFVRLNAARVILGCRSLEKGNAAKADIEASTQRPGVVDVWQLDLASFESVQDFCRRAATLERLDVVLENASVMSSTHIEAEGYEQQITVNVISTFLMALLMLPTLRRTATRFNVTPNLTIVSSEAHVVTAFRCRDAPSILETLRGPFDMDSRYGDSKLLQVLLARELASELTASTKPRIILNTVNPGLCRSNLFRNISWPQSWVVKLGFALLARTSEMGSRTLVAGATAPGETHSACMSDCRIHPESRFVRSEEGARVQKKVFDELLAILEGIQPGLRSNI